MSANLENSSGHRTGKGQFSIQSQRKAMPKNYYTIMLISHASKDMLKIPQASLQQYMNWELPDVQAQVQRGRRTRDQTASIPWIMDQARKFQNNIYFCFIDYAKAFGCVDHKKLWKFLEMGIPDHFTCLLRNLCVGQEATIRTRHGKMDWFKIGEGVHQGCILSPCLFNLYAVTCEMLGWMNHNLESRLLGEISTMLVMQIILL